MDAVDAIENSKDAVQNPKWGHFKSKSKKKLTWTGFANRVSQMFGHGKYPEGFLDKVIRPPVWPVHDRLGDPVSLTILERRNTYDDTGRGCGGAWDYGETAKIRFEHGWVEYSFDEDSCSDLWRKRVEVHFDDKDDAEEDGVGE